MPRCRSGGGRAGEGKQLARTPQRVEHPRACGVCTDAGWVWFTWVVPRCSGMLVVRTLQRAVENQVPKTSWIVCASLTMCVAVAGCRKGADGSTQAQTVESTAPVIAWSEGAERAE